MRWRSARRPPPNGGDRTGGARPEKSKTGDVASEAGEPPSITPQCRRQFSPAYEEKVLFARQRAIGVRLLTAGCRFHYIVAHQSEYLVYFHTRRGVARPHRHCERQSAASAVKPPLALFGGVYDQRSAFTFTSPKPRPI